MKKIIISLITILLMLSIVFAAKPDFMAATVGNPVTGEPKNTVTVPSKAVEVAPGLFYLGTAIDVDGRTVEGYMFIDYKKGSGKPGTECGNGACEPSENTRNCPEDCPSGNGGGGGGSDTSSCYDLFAKGARWKETEQYITGTGIDLALTETSLNTWDSEISSFNIFGAGSIGTTDGADKISPDGKNEVESIYLGADDTIAFAITWGIFRGPPSERELIEWDVTFNSYYPFGNFDGSEEVMDYQNIATHEFGHAAGMDHPKDTCTEETMYRFAAYNETKKRDLNAGDIAGINELYK